jgi:deoxyhypusine synthase
MMPSGSGPVSSFIDRHFRHFNAAALRDAADAYVRHIDAGGAMLVTLGGAMSTAELGISLAEMIRRRKVHAICCTGANLEEDAFNLLAHAHYERIPHYRDLRPEDEQALLERHLNRVTDTCIPEEEAMRRVERALVAEWQTAEQRQERLFPHECLYRVLRKDGFSSCYQIDPRDSWLVAAAECDLPLFVPGWEDSTLGNIFAARCMEGTIKDSHLVRTGTTT